MQNNVKKVQRRFGVYFVVLATCLCKTETPRVPSEWAPPALHVTPDSVHRWIHGPRPPPGPLGVVSQSDAWLSSTHQAHFWGAGHYQEQLRRLCADASSHARIRKHKLQWMSARLIYVFSKTRMPVDEKRRPLPKPFLPQLGYKSTAAGCTQQQTGGKLFNNFLHSGHRISSSDAGRICRVTHRQDGNPCMWPHCQHLNDVSLRMKLVPALPGFGRSTSFIVKPARNGANMWTKFNRTHPTCIVCTMEYVCIPEACVFQQVKVLRAEARRHYQQFVPFSHIHRALHCWGQSWLFPRRSRPWGYDFAS